MVGSGWFQMKLAALQRVRVAPDYGNLLAVTRASGESGPEMARYRRQAELFDPCLAHAFEKMRHGACGIGNVRFAPRD